VHYLKTAAMHLSVSIRHSASPICFTGTRVEVLKASVESGHVDDFVL
jgi:hypothetical protein